MRKVSFIYCFLMLTVWMKQDNVYILLIRLFDTSSPNFPGVTSLRTFFVQTIFSKISDEIQPVKFPKCSTIILHSSRILFTLWLEKE